MWFQRTQIGFTAANRALRSLLLLAAKNPHSLIFWAPNLYFVSVCMKRKWAYVCMCACMHMCVPLRNSLQHLKVIHHQYNIWIKIWGHLAQKSSNVRAPKKDSRRAVTESHFHCRWGVTWSTQGILPKTKRVQVFSCSLKPQIAYHF